MRPKQPLFAVTYWLLKAAIVLSIFVIVLLALALGGLLVVGTTFSANRLGMPLSLSGADRFNLMAVVSFVITYGMAYTALVFFALRATAAIIETAISGDPFVTENAERLVRIGWLLLAGEIINLPALVVVKFMFARLSASLVQQANFHFCLFGITAGGAHDAVCGAPHATSDLSPIGILAVLLIFVLAQIFRRGSEMRAELEATV